jgi:hypothetical protein
VGVEGDAVRFETRLDQTIIDQSGAMALLRLNRGLTVGALNCGADGGVSGQQSGSAVYYSYDVPKRGIESRTIAQEFYAFHGSVDRVRAKVRSVVVSAIESPATSGKVFEVPPLRSKQIGDARWSDSRPRISDAT